MDKLLAEHFIGISFSELKNPYQHQFCQVKSKLREESQPTDKEIESNRLVWFMYLVKIIIDSNRVYVPTQDIISSEGRECELHHSYSFSHKGRNITMLSAKEVYLILVRIQLNFILNIYWVFTLNRWFHVNFMDFFSQQLPEVCVLTSLETIELLVYLTISILIWILISISISLYLHIHNIYIYLHLYLYIGRTSTSYFCAVTFFPHCHYSQMWTRMPKKPLTEKLRKGSTFTWKFKNLSLFRYNLIQVLKWRRHK